MSHVADQIEKIALRLMEELINGTMTLLESVILTSMRINATMNNAQKERPMLNTNHLNINHYVGIVKKATNVSLAETLIAEAKALHINVSQAAEAGLARAVAEKRAELWLEENREAIESSNDYVNRHGLPLERFRMF